MKKICLYNSLSDCLAGGIKKNNRCINFDIILKHTSNKSDKSMKNNVEHY